MARQRHGSSVLETNADPFISGKRRRRFSGRNPCLIASSYTPSQPFMVYPLPLDVLQLSGWLVGDVKESRNGNPTGDLQMEADRTRHHPLCRAVVSSLFSFATWC